MSGKEATGSAGDPDLRQGDLVLLCLGRQGEGIGLARDSKHRVVLLSQTCDLVQASKHYCLVAPIIDASPAEISAARKGKSPLSLFLDDSEGRGPWVADIGRALSVPKSRVMGAEVIARCVDSASSTQARRLGARIGRAFSRFPFPNEVFPVFSQLQGKLRDKAGTSGNLGQVIDLVEEIRVSADQWEMPGRRLHVHVIVSSDELIPAEDADPAWAWDRIQGWRTSDAPGGLAVDRICELILANQRGDLTSLMHLWHEFGQSMSSAFLQPSLDSEVVEIVVDVVNDLDFTHRDVARSESLDLETLSDTRTA